MAFSLPFFKKSEDRNLEEFRDITDDVDESEFVPYSCLYDPHTIVTKNGELLQTIRITGFSNAEMPSGEDLRSAIRKAIVSDIDSDRYALWFHTIRRPRVLNLGSQEGSEQLSRYIGQAWRNKNQWDHIYANDICITIVREGQSAPLLNPLGFMRGLWVPLDRRHRETHLENSLLKLNDTVERMLASLAPYGAKRLGLYERDGAFYSETLEFLSSLINLKDEPILVPEADLSQYLTMNDVTFGYNAMEVRHHDGRRRFATLLTIKEYHELPLEAMSKFLDLPDEFIVTQCIDFINRKEALSGYQYQKQLYTVSGDHHLSEITGLDDVIQSDTGHPLDFGQQQLSLFLQANDIKTLERTVNHVVTTLTKLGMIAIREDIKLEECYWAQLPGNFEFVKRLSPINTSRIAGFASLSALPMGRAEGNPWGQAITAFRTVSGSVYFFNFHYGANGHTAILGGPQTGKTALVNFLLSESRKLGTRQFIFDSQQSSEIYVRGIGGHYHVFSPESRGRLQMNPLALPDTESNRIFLSAWVESLISPQGRAVNPAIKSVIEAALTRLYQGPATQRHLRGLAAQDPSLERLLANWIGQGPCASLFDHEQDTIEIAQVQGYDFTTLLMAPHVLGPVLAYLLHRVITVLDGTPTILVFDRAWTMFDNPLIGSRLRGFLKLLTERNAIAIFTGNVEEAAAKPFCSEMLSYTATQIYMPDALPTEAYTRIFGLSETDVDYLEAMNETDRHFLVKQGEQTVIGSFDMEGIDALLPILASNETDRQRMEATVQNVGSNNPASWMPAFLKDA